MRLFIAAPLKNDAKDYILSLQESLKDKGVKGHFTPDENLHITLAFIGEYGNEEDVTEAISNLKFKPIKISLSGLGNFRNTFWIGIDKNEELIKLAKTIRKSLTDNNISYDKKKFQGHITIIRKTEFEGRFEELLKDCGQFETKVNEVVLMRSDRGKNGMIYTPLFEINGE